MNILVLLLLLFITTALGLAQDQPTSSDVIAQMKTQLDLQETQVYNITPIIEKYTKAFYDLQTSVKGNTINSSAVSSQWQGLEDQETQEISQYLKPNQLSEWRTLQSQLYAPKDQNDSDTKDDDADKYTNLPQETPPQN